jgi:hypothetical protein
MIPGAVGPCLAKGRSAILEEHPAVHFLDREGAITASTPTRPSRATAVPRATSRVASPWPRTDRDPSGCGRRSTTAGRGPVPARPSPRTRGSRARRSPSR